jgi:hypothetical protein
MFVFSSLPQMAQAFITDSVAQTRGLTDTPQLYTNSLFLPLKTLKGNRNGNQNKPNDFSFI